MAVGALVSVGVVATRFVHLDDAPGEWYGDISTVYEYVVNLRNGTGPDGYYSLGTGVLYPQAIRPVLWLAGDSYLSIKTAGALYSLVGLLLLFMLARSLVNSTFAVMATVLAGASSWWLIFSRLGDVQALTPTLSLAAVGSAFVAVRRASTVVWPAMCGLFSGLGLYLYGNTLILPVITGLTLVVAWRLRRSTASAVGMWAAATLLTAAPFLDDFWRHPDAVIHSHNGERLVSGWEFFPNLLRGIRKTFFGYLSRGDPGFRGNPMSAAHIDHLSLVFGLIGIAFWLRPVRRRKGIFLVGTFLLLHVPSLLVSADQLPSASRTVAAAPFAYLLVAGGIWWMGGLCRRFGSAESLIAMTVIVACIATFNIYVYVHTYLPGLPYRNVPIARSIVDYADSLPSDVNVHLVGTGWSDHGMPEIKSVIYAARRPNRIVEDDPTTFDCAMLETVARPAVLVWRFDAALPGVDLSECAEQLSDVRTIHHSGRPVFRTATVTEPESG